MQTIYLYERELCLTVEKSKFLIDIITLVSLVNKMGSDKVFIVGGMSFIYIIKTKAL
jgi:hypothetical protein